MPARSPAGGDIRRGRTGGLRTVLRRSASPPLRRSAVVTPVAGGPSAPDPVVPAAAAAAPAFLADGDTVGAMAGEVVELRGAA